jgi:hypothetical protein
LIRIEGRGRYNNPSQIHASLDHPWILERLTLAATKPAAALMVDYLPHVLFAPVLRAYLASREQRPVDWLGALPDSKIEEQRENGARLDDERGKEQLKALATTGAREGAHLSQAYKS